MSLLFPYCFPIISFWLVNPRLQSPFPHFFGTNHQFSRYDKIIISAGELSNSGGLRTIKAPFPFLQLRRAAARLREVEGAPTSRWSPTSPAGLGEQVPQCHHWPGLVNINEKLWKDPPIFNGKIHYVYIVYVYIYIWQWVKTNSNLVVHIKIAGKWMFIPLKMVLIG